jgi:hypothetical protein
MSEVPCWGEISLRCYIHSTGQKWSSNIMQLFPTWLWGGLLQTPFPSLLPLLARGGKRPLRHFKASCCFLNWSEKVLVLPFPAAVSRAQQPLSSKHGSMCFQYKTKDVRMFLDISPNIHTPSSKTACKHKSTICSDCLGILSLPGPLQK